MLNNSSHTLPSSRVFNLLFFTLGYSICREILQPRDMITIPTDDNTYMHFCGQFCLSVFRHKKKQTDKIPDKWTDKRQERKPEKQTEKPVDRQPDRPICSVCKVSNRVRRLVLTLKKDFGSLRLRSLF